MKQRCSEPQVSKERKRMTPDVIEEGVICMGILGVLLLVLGIGCLIADYALPHIPFIRRCLEQLLGSGEDNQD